jgi:pyruvate dehydrogenase E2 component (dihydrolipoamide acetyltransferase)
VASDVVMPRLSDSMEEGTILRWLVEEGGEVRRGEPLVEIETDKANTTYDAEAGGTLVELVAREGDTLPVGAVIARIGGDGAPGGGKERREPGAKGESQVVELTKLQQTVSRRTAESKATAPHLSLTVEADCTLAVELRRRLGKLADGEPPSVDEMIVKVAATALRDHPRVNGAYRDGKLELYSRVNVGISTPARDALVVPTIFDADRKSLGEISREARELAEKARSGTIAAPELAGGTFTVSSLGAFGIDEFSAAINPPQAAMLTVGSMKKRPLVDKDSGRVVARNTVRLTLLADQRILYGADAAEFLARVRELLEDPLSMTL